MWVTVTIYIKTTRWVGKKQQPSKKNSMVFLMVDGFKQQTWVSLKFLSHGSFFLKKWLPDPNLFRDLRPTRKGNFLLIRRKFHKPIIPFGCTFGIEDYLTFSLDISSFGGVKGWQVMISSSLLCPKCKLSNLWIFEEATISVGDPLCFDLANRPSAKIFLIHGYLKRWKLVHLIFWGS